MKHTIIDFEQQTESIRKDGRRHDYNIDWIKVFPNFLHFKRRYVNHQHHKYVEYFLFPNENIGIYKLYQYEDIVFEPSEVFKYYVDMVSVEKKDNSWIIKDLYIDFIIKQNNKYYVVDIDEFSYATKTKELDDTDVANALNGLDNILKGYYMDFDIESYISRLTKKYGKQ